MLQNAVELTAPRWLMLLVTVPSADLTINQTLLPVRRALRDRQVDLRDTGISGCLAANETCAGTPPTNTVGIAFPLQRPFAAGQVPLPSVIEGVIEVGSLAARDRVCASWALMNGQAPVGTTGTIGTVTPLNLTLTPLSEGRK
jgi:hypothetical protein